MFRIARYEKGPSDNLFLMVYIFITKRGEIEILEA